MGTFLILNLKSAPLNLFSLIANLEHSPTFSFRIGIIAGCAIIQISWHLVWAMVAVIYCNWFMVLVTGNRYVGMISGNTMGTEKSRKHMMQIGLTSLIGVNKQFEHVVYNPAGKFFGWCMLFLQSCNYSSWGYS